MTPIKFSLYLLAAPSKPKFLEHLINRVSKKVGRDTNGLVDPLPLDTADESVTDEPLSPDSERCLEVVESLAEGLIACTQRPVSGESCDSGQGSSLLESASDFSPTSKRKSWSTPASPTFQGIVKQRLKNFQALRETSLPPREVRKDSPRRPSYKNNRELEESAKKFHCSEKQDDKFTQAVMESGYVKALVSRLNKSTSYDTDGNENIDDTRRVSDDVVNGVKVSLKEHEDDWPDEFSGGDVKEDNDNDSEATSSPSKCHSVKDQLRKFETNSVKSKGSICSSSSWKKKSESDVSNVDSSKSTENSESDSHKKELNKQEKTLNGSTGGTSSSEHLTATESTTRTLSESETQVSRALKRFNHERHKHISSRLCSTSASSSYSSLLNNYTKSPPFLRRPKSSDAAKSNANNVLNGANAKYLEKSRSVDLERSSDTASSSPVSCSFDFGLSPLSPEELFDQNWSKSEFTFDDFSDESEYDGLNISKKKVILMWYCVSMQIQRSSLGVF